MRQPVIALRDVNKGPEEIDDTEKRSCFSKPWKMASLTDHELRLYQTLRIVWSEKTIALAVHRFDRYLRGDIQCRHANALEGFFNPDRDGFIR